MNTDGLLAVHRLLKLPTVADLTGKGSPEAPPLRPAARQGRRPPKGVPLSFAQQRLWFLDRYEPDSALHNLPATFRLTGHLDQEALARALNEIMRRHEVLRTSFATRDEESADGGPVQVIRPATHSPLPVLDLSDLPDPQRRAEAHRLALAEARRPFDLAQGPVLRVGLLRLRPQEHTLLLTVHHIVFDGWSLGVFLHELAVLYRAFSVGPRLDLPELPVQYADFAVWQRWWLSGDRTPGEVRETLLSYWRQQLRGLPVLELPTDRQRPAIQSVCGTSQPWSLPAKPGRRLEALGREHETTLAMTLLAAFQVLLGRYSGQQDLAVGVAVANRDRGEVESLVGPFTNTLVLRGDLSGDAGRGGLTFRSLLARSRDVFHDACAHHDLPFELLVEELAPERDLSRNPLVQVLFVIRSHPPALPRELAPGLGVELGAVATGAVTHDLTLVLAADRGRLEGALEYNVDLFDATTIRQHSGDAQRFQRRPSFRPASGPSAGGDPRGLCPSGSALREAGRGPPARAPGRWGAAARGSVVQDGRRWDWRPRPA